MPYGITRRDHDPSRTHAWVVTLSRKGEMFRMHFSDGVHGGKRKALAAAKAWRDAIIEKHPPLTVQEHCSILKKNNRSGIAGVCRAQNTDGRWYWVARWSPAPYKGKQVKFSIHKYGEQGAFRRAVRARKQALAALEGFFDPARHRRPAAR